MKIIPLLLAACFAIDSHDVVHSVVAGLDAAQECERPNHEQIDAIAEMFHASTFSTYDLCALISAESKWCTAAESAKSAYGICQITPSTKSWLLAGDTDEHSPVQDVRLCLRLLEIIKTAYARAGVTATWEQIVWGYNAGYTTVLSKGWLTNARAVWIQPKSLARDVRYYSKNYQAQVYDIDVADPGYRFTLKQYFDSVKFRINPQFQSVYIDRARHTLRYGTNVFPVSVGEVRGRDTVTPAGTFRIIWKLWYSRNEGGPFGNSAMRLNFRYNNGASAYIHGTDKPWNIGSNTTLGCIALSNQHSKYLFDCLEIGDYVYIK